jgi:hypothetical protein
MTLSAKFGYAFMSPRPSESVPRVAQEIARFDPLWPDLNWGLA